MTNFTRHNTGDWQINDDLRSAVSFRRHNLLHPAQDLGAFDIILCSHVLSGLGKAAQREAINAMTAQLLPSAYLFLSRSENAEGVSDAIKPSREMRGAFEKQTKSVKSAVA